MRRYAEAIGPSIDPLLQPAHAHHERLRGHASETEKAAALLPKLGTAQEAPLWLVKQVQVA